MNNVVHVKIIEQAPPVLVGSLEAAIHLTCKGQVSLDDAIDLVEAEDGRSSGLIGLEASQALLNRLSAQD